MNKKLNKKQTLIYVYLISRPGYLKKSLSWLIGNLEEWLTDNKVNNKDVEKALIQAKLDYKKSLDDKLTYSKGKTIKKSFAEIFPWSTDNVKREINILKELDSSIKQAKAFDKNNVLSIADQHEPFCKEGYLEHCIAIRDKYKCGTIVLIGDEVDLCGVSQWEKDPDGFSAGTEANLAQEKMKLWYVAFPEAYVCIGNHTARPFRQAKANGVPKKFIKSYEEAWEAPSTWKWADSWEFNNVFYTHGTGNSGAGAAIKIATRHRQNTVIGHIHSEAGIQYSASKIDLVWGMQLGGALDDTSYAAYYAKTQLKKSIVGCGVVLNGKLPIYEPMML